MATAPLPTPPLVVALALELVSAPLRNFLKVIGGRPGPPTGATEPMVVDVVMVETV